MAFSNFFSFFTVLKQSIKILPKNGKLMAFLAISSMLLYSALFLLFNCSVQAIIKDLYAEIMKSLNAAQFDHLKEDIAFLLADYTTFILSFAILGFFLSVATVVVSATSYIKKTMSFKDLFSMIGKTWIRTLITTFYVSGLSLGYSLCFFALVMSPLAMYPNPIAISVAVVIGVPALILSLYLSVSWMLAIVVSVVEEDCYGADALARAGRLVKGKRLEGFMLIFCFSLVAMIISQGYTMTIGIKGVGSATIYGLVVANASLVLKIMLMVAYSVFYFECKKHHGEEIGELHGSVQYAKLPTAASASDIV